MTPDGRGRAGRGPPARLGDRSCVRPIRRDGGGGSRPSRRRRRRTYAQYRRAPPVRHRADAVPRIATSRSCGSATSCSTPPGIDLAAELGVPSVLFVPATHVWEAEQWGTRRPGWRKHRRTVSARRRRCDGPTSSRAAPSSSRSRRAGSARAPARSSSRRPGSTSTRSRSRPIPRSRARTRSGSTAGSSSGWVGSFRRFHALDQAFDALAGIEDATLLLVGDGPERPRIEAARARRGTSRPCSPARFPHAELARHLAAMDVAVVLAGRDDVFHYSPLKLAEYLAAGRAVVAPDVPQISARLTTASTPCSFHRATPRRWPAPSHNCTTSPSCVARSRAAVTRLRSIASPGTAWCAGSSRSSKTAPELPVLRT